IVDPFGTWTFAALDERADDLARRLLGDGNLNESRIALLAEPGHRFVVGALGVWRAGGVLRPVLPTHPGPELAVLRDHAAAGTTRAGVDGTRTSSPSLSPVAASAAALMIHTSGTTGRPKGVVHTHASLAAQIDGMIASWGWSPDDRIVSVLPLNHVHGLVNVT